MQIEKKKKKKKRRGLASARTSCLAATRGTPQASDSSGKRCTADRRKGGGKEVKASIRRADVLEVHPARRLQKRKKGAGRCGGEKGARVRHCSNRCRCGTAGGERFDPRKRSGGVFAPEGKGGGKGKVGGVRGSEARLCSTPQGDLSTFVRKKVGLRKRVRYFEIHVCTDEKIDLSRGKDRRWRGGGENRGAPPDGTRG